MTHNATQAVKEAVSYNPRKPACDACVTPRPLISFMYAPGISRATQKATHSFRPDRRARGCDRSWRSAVKRTFSYPFQYLAVCCVWCGLEAASMPRRVPQGGEKGDWGPGGCGERAGADGAGGPRGRRRRPLRDGEARKKGRSLVRGPALVVGVSLRQRRGVRGCRACGPCR